MCLLKCRTTSSVVDVSVVCIIPVFVRSTVLRTTFAQSQCCLLSQQALFLSLFFKHFLAQFSSFAILVDVICIARLRCLLSRFSVSDFLQHFSVDFCLPLFAGLECLDASLVIEVYLPALSIKEVFVHHFVLLRISILPLEISTLLLHFCRLHILCNILFVHLVF